MNDELRDLLSDVFAEHWKEPFVLYLDSGSDLLLGQRGQQDPEYMLCLRSDESTGKCDEGTLQGFKEIGEAIEAVVATIAARFGWKADEAERWLLNELQA